MLETLNRSERMRLIRFLCAFAWADLEVHAAERGFVSRLVRDVVLGPEERAQVESWLEVPPPIDEVDPAEIPAEHRELFLKTIEDFAEADGDVSPDERETLAVLTDLLRSTPRT